MSPWLILCCYKWRNNLPIGLFYSVYWYIWCNKLAKNRRQLVEMKVFPYINGRNISTTIINVKIKAYIYNTYIYIEMLSENMAIWASCHWWTEHTPYSWHKIPCGGGTRIDRDDVSRWIRHPDVWHKSWSSSKYRVWLITIMMLCNRGLFYWRKLCQVLDVIFVWLRWKDLGKYVILAYFLECFIC